MTIQYKPLINKLPLSYNETCNLETALVIAKAYLKSTNDKDGIISEKAAKYEQLYKRVSDFNKAQKWTEIVFPPEIQRVLRKETKEES